MTDFVVPAVQDAAQPAIEQAEVMRLTLAGQECFAKALMAPPEPAPALERAFHIAASCWVFGDERAISYSFTRNWT